VANKYEINTGSIFMQLTAWDEKWKKYDRQFLIKTFQDAIQSALWQKNIISIQYNGENGSYLENYENIRYPTALKNSEDGRVFPFPDYFLRNDKESEYLNIVNYVTNCFINKWDNNFDLFFSLQFSLTEILKGDESQAEDFLKYHLQNTFENDFQKFKSFLENLCLKYSEFLKYKYEALVKRFIENEIAAQRESVIGAESKVSFETNKPIETIHLSIVEKVVPEIVEIIPELPPGFEQIKCEATEKEILNYFMILSKEENSLNKEYFMDEKDVEEFVKKNFFIFNCIPTGKYFSINLLPNQKRILIYFMFTFYLKYDRKVANTKIKYVNLLINNFELFKSDKPKSLLSNMSESKKPINKNCISTKEYFSNK
jgi:hypothetical protein